MQAFSVYEGYVIDYTGCDDTASGIYPGASELCDGKDNDYDGEVPANKTDADSDGYMICEGDCKDTNPTIHLAPQR